MRTKPLFFVVSLTSLAIAATANAAEEYDYSYTFGNGEVVSGLLTGDQNGNIIDNLSDVTVSFTSGGITAQMNGTVVSESWNGSAYVVGGAQVSVDGTANNFIFENGIGTGDYFQSQNIGPNDEIPIVDYSYVNSSDYQSDSDDYPLIFSNWSVTAVPEPTTYGVFAGALTMVPFASSTARKLRKRV